MNKKWASVAILSAILIGAFLWLARGRTVVISLDNRRLPAIVDLHYFTPLRPDMQRSEICRLLGEPHRIHVTDIEYDADGEVEYQEIRWEYARDRGVLAYYVEEYDTPGGSVEYVPEHLRVEDFFLIPVNVGFGKRFVDVRDAQGILLTVRIGKGCLVDRINWYSTR